MLLQPMMHNQPHNPHAFEYSDDGSSHSSDSDPFIVPDSEVESDNSSPQTPTVTRAPLSQTRRRTRRIDRNAFSEAEDDGFSGSDESPTPYTRHRDINSGPRNRKRVDLLCSRLEVLAEVMEDATNEIYDIARQVSSW